MTILEYLIRIKIALAAGAAGGGGGGSGTTLPNPLGATNVEDILKTIVSYLFTISIPLVSIMIIIGAFQILFAGGNPEKISTGKKTILYSVVGFAIILASTGLVLLIKELLGAS